MERDIKEGLLDSFEVAPSASPGSTPSRAEAEGGIPDIVIRRLPIYARSLQFLISEGVDTISSGDLGARLGASAAQIRRDLSYFGEFGKQGKGYKVDFLLSQISAILGLNRQWPVALVGLGHLGRALLHYEGFTTQGFQFRALFDHSPEKIGQRLNGLKIVGMKDMAKVLAAEEIRMAIIAVPAAGAQQAANALVESGVRAILNYAPIIVRVPPHVKIRHIDPVVALQSMTYYLSEAEQSASANSIRHDPVRLGRLE